MSMSPVPKGLLKNRSVVEIMVLVFTFTVSFVLTGSITVVAIVEIFNPETDTAGAAQTIVTLISGIIGALLGLIAGKSQATQNLNVRANGTESDLGEPQL